MANVYDIVIRPIITERSMASVADVSDKAKRMGAGRPGTTRSWKKAYVQLTADSKTIEMFEGMV